MDSNMQELYRNSTMALLQAKKRMGSEGDPAFLDGARRVLDFMYKIWQDQKLCDVLITSNGGNVQAHRVVLGAYSDTLNRTFQGYNSGDMVKLDLTDFRSEVVMAILNFMYTTELELNCHMIGQVLACANELGIDVIIQVCMDYLNTLDANNAILHYSIAENNSLNDVRERAFNFMLDNFTEVSFTRHFLYLPFERLFKLVKSENLCINNELDVFSAVVRWVDFDVRQRLSYGYQLLDCVNFENLPPESLTLEVEAVGWIINNPECVKNYLYRAMKYNALKSEGSPLADSYIPRERRCLKADQDSQQGSTSRFKYPFQKQAAPPMATASGPLNSTGSSEDKRQLSQHFKRRKRHDHEEFQPIRGQGQDDNNEGSYEPEYNKAQGYEQGTGQRFSVGPRRRGAQQHSSNNISASAAQHSASSSVDTFQTLDSGVPSTYREFQKNLKTKNFHVLRGPETRQRSLQSSGLSNKRRRNSRGQLQVQAFLLQPSEQSDGQLPVLSIVTVGGIDLESIDPDTPGKYLYVYQSQYNRWSTLTGPTKRYIHHHGVGIIDGKLYIVGGAVYRSKHPDNLGVSTNAVHVFDPVSNDWYQAASMIYSRAYAALVVWKKQLLVIGGEDSAKQKLDTIECYDPVADNWTVITQMPGGAKVGVSAAVFLDCLFVVGGYNREREYNAVLADVECYDLLGKSWTILGPLEIPRCHASLIEVNKRLFLIGGRTVRSKQGIIPSVGYVEEYDFSSDTWKRIANMETPRHDAGCTAVGNLIYIMGGMRSPNSRCLQSVECFNTVTGTWVKGVDDFPHPVAGIACCVIAGT